MPNSNVLEVVIRAQNQMGPGLASAQQSVSTFGASVKALGGALLATGAATVVLSQIADSVKKFMEAEAGMRALKASLETIGADVGKVTGKVEEMILAWEKASIFDDDELRASLTTLITITGDVAASTGTMQSVMDLAAARGLSLASASELVGRALEGNVIQLGRMGIKFNEADRAVFKYGTEVDRAAVLTERLNESMGMRAQAQIDSYVGKVKLVTNAWGDAKESIGKFLIEGLAGIVAFGERVGIEADKIGNYFRVMRGQAPIEIKTYGVEGGVRTSIGVAQAADAARASAAAAEAAEKARKAAEAWKSELEQLNAQWVDLMRNVAASPKGFEANAAAIVKITDRMLELGKTLNGAQTNLREMAQALSDLPQQDYHVQLFVAFGDRDQDADEWFREMQAKFAPGWKVPLKLIVPPRIPESDFRPITAGFEKSISEAGTRGLEAMIEDFAVTGGANLASIIESVIAEGARAGAKALVDILSEAIRPSAAARLTRQPGETEEAFAARQQSAGADVMGRIGTGISGALGLFNTVANPNPQSDVGTVTSATLAGASLGSAINVGLGTLIGAVVGLLIGGITAALSSVGDTYKYGIPSIRGGEARFIPGQNIAVREAEEIQQRMQEIFNTTYDGFAKILLKLQDFVPDFLRNMDINFRTGLESGGYIGRDASANFMKHLERLITEGIPSEVGKKFKPVFAGAFESMGFTTERFNEIWDELAQMDAQKGIALLGQLVDAMVSLKESMADFTTPIGGFTGTAGGVGAATAGSLLAREQERSQRSFADALRETDAEIIRLAGTLDDLTTEGQIQTLSQIADLEEQRQQSILAFLQQTLQIVEQVNATIEAGIAELELRGLTDPQQKIDYLEASLERDRQLLLAATTPEAAREISDRMFRTIFQILDISQGLGPDDAERFRLWGIDALRGLQGDFNARVNVLLDDINTRNREFMDSWQPVYDRWMTELDNASNSVGPFADGLDRGRDSIEAFSSAVDRATGRIDGLGGGAGGETVYTSSPSSYDAGEEAAFVNSVVLTRGMRGRVA